MNLNKDRRDQMRSFIAIVTLALVAFVINVQPVYADCNTDCAAKPAGPMHNACLVKCMAAAKAEPAKADTTDDGDVSPTGLKAVADAVKAQDEKEADNTADIEPKDDSLPRVTTVLFIFIVFVFIILMIIAFFLTRLQTKVKKNFDTLKHCIAQRPGYGEMKKFIQLFTELAELRSRLEYEKSSRDTQAISSRATELSERIRKVQEEKNNLMSVIEDARSRVNAAKADLPHKPDKLIIKFANQGDSDAKAVVEAYNSAVNIVKRSEALLADLEAKMTPLDLREEQLGQMLEEASAEVNSVRQIRSALALEIKAKEAEIESLTSSPPPLPLRR